ncbi:MAG: hypothetical protein ACLQVI_01730 [Polyangiaceae bacterium]
MWEIWIAVGSAALFFAQVAILMRLSAARGLEWTSWARSAFLGAMIFVAVLMTSAFGPMTALAAGLACNVFVGGRMFQATRRALRVRRLLKELAGPDATKALGALDHEIEGLRGGHGGEKSNYDHRARWVLSIAANVALAGHAQRALDWTRRLEPVALGRPVAAMHAQHEAAFRIAIGDRDGARQAIARAPRPAIAPWEDALEALEALLEALDGDAQAAVDRTAGALERAPAGPSRATWQMARAHGLAKRGAVEDAREVLRTMRSEGGDSLLRRIVAHAGPASRLAETILSEQGAYR